MKLEQKIVSKYPILGSSQNPEEISMTIKGVALAIIPVLSLVLAKFGVSQERLRDLVEAVFGVVGAALVLWGVIRKFKK